MEHLSHLFELLGIIATIVGIAYYTDRVTNDSRCTIFRKTVITAVGATMILQLYDIYYPILMIGVLLVGYVLNTMYGQPPPPIKIEKRI